MKRIDNVEYYTKDELPHIRGLSNRLIIPCYIDHALREILILTVKKCLPLISALGIVGGIIIGLSI